MQTTSNDIYTPLIRQIGNILTINVQRIEKTGLIYGHIGVMLFMYHYARFTGISQFEDSAESIFDFVIEDHMKKMRRTFFDGLYGVGWAIKYLIKHQLVKANENALNDYELIASQRYTNADILIDTQSDIPVLSKGLYCLDLKNATAVADTFILIHFLMSDDYKGKLNTGFLNSVMYFLMHCQSNKQYEPQFKNLLKRLNEKYNTAIENGLYEPIDILLINKLQKFDLIEVTTPKVKIDPLNVFSSWQSIVYEKLTKDMEMPSVLDIQAYIDAINLNMSTKQLSLQGLSALGINLIQRVPI
jgi:hypothetical protein